MTPNKQVTLLASLLSTDREDLRKQRKGRTRSRRSRSGWRIIVLATPGWVLAKMLREVAEQESEGDIKYKVGERGGKSVEKMLNNTHERRKPKIILPTVRIFGVYLYLQRVSLRYTRSEVHLSLQTGSVGAK